VIVAGHREPSKRRAVVFSSARTGRGLQPAGRLSRITGGAVHVRAVRFVRFHPVLPFIAEVAYARVKTEGGAGAVLSIWQEWWV